MTTTDPSLTTTPVDDKDSLVIQLVAQNEKRKAAKATADAASADVVSKQSALATAQTTAAAAQSDETTQESAFNAIVDQLEATVPHAPPPAPGT